jgi:hypothetical protein
MFLRRIEGTGKELDTQVSYAVCDMIRGAFLNFIDKAECVGYDSELLSLFENFLSSWWNFYQVGVVDLREHVNALLAYELHVNPNQDSTRDDLDVVSVPVLTELISSRVLLSNAHGPTLRLRELLLRIAKKSKGEFDFHSTIVQASLVVFDVFQKSWDLKLFALERWIEGATDEHLANRIERFVLDAIDFKEIFGMNILDLSEPGALSLGQQRFLDLYRLIECVGSIEYTKFFVHWFIQWATDVQVEDFFCALDLYNNEYRIWLLENQALRAFHLR